MASSRLQPSQHPVESDSDEALLDAVDRLFYERGFQAVSMDQLRDASGVPLKRIYARFPSKTDLIQAYLMRQDALWRDGFERFVTSRSDDPEAQLLLVFDAVEAWVKRREPFRGCAFHNAFGELAGTSEFASTIVKAHKHHVRRFLERTAARAGVPRPKDLATQLMLLVEGALMTSAIDGNPASARAAKTAARTLLAAANGDRRGPKSVRRNAEPGAER